MDVLLSDQLRQETIRIGDELLTQAAHDIHGMSWQCIEQYPNSIGWEKSENLYQGVSGIVLFMAQLYKQTQQEKYLHAAQEGMRWIEWYCHTTLAHSYSFLTGRMSVPYTYIQLYNITHQHDYLYKALDLTIEGLQNWQPTITEYINGTAGVILCLLHLHAATQEQKLLTYIDQYVGKLLACVHLGKKGMYWDRSPMNIHGLCGFSHGAAGIGYVLLELGHYFQNKAFYWLAEQAFTYENQFFSQNQNNWYDLRKAVYSINDGQLHQEAYLSGNINFFTKASFLNAWCHGAAGIGLVRLRAYELLHKPIYAQQAQQAIKCTKLSEETSNDTTSFTLCHGRGGNAEIFLQAYQVWNDPYYLSLAYDVAKKALLVKHKGHAYSSGYRYAGEDTSLFMGNAGVGYFYLRVLNPLDTPSVLMPSIHSVALTHVSGYRNLALSIEEVNVQLCNQQFPRTCWLLSKFHPQTINKTFNIHNHSSQNLLDHFITNLNQALSKQTAKQAETLNDVFVLEQAKAQLSQNIASDALLNHKNNVKAVRAKVLTALTEAALQEVTLVADSDLQLLSTRWYWSSHSTDQWISNQEASSGEYSVLLIPALEYIGEQSISKLAHTLLLVFKEPKTVHTALLEILDQFGQLPDEQVQKVTQLFFTQLTEIIRAGFLIEPTQHPLQVITQTEALVL